MKEVVLFIIFVSFFTIVVSIGFFFSKNFNFKQFIGVNESSTYQAITLVNGQTFFGKVEDHTSDPLTLSNVFYIQEKPVVQTSTSSAIPIPTLVTAPVPGPNELIKLEYGDKKRDFVKIKRKLILYIQSLRADSKVLQLMKQYYEAKTKGTQSPVTTSDKVEVSAE